ncbi:hypothetical protein [Demequina sp. NBRC 110053]|uniref:hypothetical protein n=1 Tax=Demequina sp. NBRC 110053 TaxID=1570342 RepID=UPI0009FBD00C|nr:hypothetical protein [Demequina sp. NBRC 110053]
MDDDSRARPALTRTVGEGTDLLERVRARSRVLASIRSACVLAPVSVRADAHGRVLVNVPAVDGPDLAELAMRRPPLSVGECAWLARGVGEGLARMHEAGLAHGDLAPANVAIGPEYVVLLDTIAGCVEDESGTPGFRAPERVGGATLPGDVYSFGALLRWAVGDADRAIVEAWTAPLLVSDPRQRPDIHVAVRALDGLAAPARVSVPSSADVIAAARARAAPRTERIAAGRWWRARRTAERALAAGAVATAAATIVVGVPWAVDAVLPQSSAAVAAAPTSEPPTVAAPAQLVAQASAPDGHGGSRAMGARAGLPEAAIADREHPGRAAVALTLARMGALRDGDGEQLRRLAAAQPDSRELSESIERIAVALDAGELTYTGLAARIERVEVVDTTARAATVSLTYSLGAHRVIEAGRTTDVAASVESVVLHLRWDGRWTVEAVREP